MGVVDPSQPIIDLRQKEGILRRSRIQLARPLEPPRSIAVISGKALDAPAEDEPERIPRLRGSRAFDLRDRLFVVAGGAKGPSANYRIDF